jgi:protein O-mannosyl-transferase
MTPLSRKAGALGAAALVLITLLAYTPATRSGFIWDDDVYIENNQTLRTADGLRQIWSQPGATPQYYPLVFTSFWLEYHIWGLQPAGYHLVNVLLHAANALLLWVVLRRLAVPGAWFAAAIFALHPVAVESVAWVTERKNVLSGFFYFCALLAYLRFCLPVEPTLPAAKGKRDRPSTRLRSHAATGAFASGGWGWYALAFGLFVCALLSKTVTCSLPAAVLLLLWWKRGALTWRDVAATIPFFVAGIALALVTIWMEKHIVGAEGDEWTLLPIERCLLAGRALWFYVAKLVWPTGLIFIYPRWQMDYRVWWQYLYPAAAVAVIVALWLARGRLGRGPLVAVLLFAGTLLPALGFIDIYPMRFSFVADHFQYLASAALITLAVAAVAGLRTRYGPAENWKAAGVASAYLLCLGVLTWNQTEVYKDRETLWTNTLAKNPSCRMAHNNLGTTLAREGRVEEAMKHFTAAIALNPDDPRAHFNLGQLFEGAGKLDAAAYHLREALRINPEAARVQNELGRILLQQRKPAEAAEHLTEAVRLNPDYPDAVANLVLALADAGKPDQAVKHLTPGLDSAMNADTAYVSLGNAFRDKGKLDSAREYYRRALAIVRSRDPNWQLASLQSAWALATDPDAKQRNGLLAVELALPVVEGSMNPQPEALDILAAAYAENGQFSEAIRFAHDALSRVGDQTRPGLEKQIDERLRLYEKHQPFHRPPSATGTGN